MESSAGYFPPLGRARRRDCRRLSALLRSRYDEDLRSLAERGNTSVTNCAALTVRIAGSTEIIAFANDQLGESPRDRLGLLSTAWAGQQMLRQ